VPRNHQPQLGKTQLAGQPHALFSSGEKMSIPIPMARRAASAKHPADITIALAVAVSVTLFAWGLGEFLRSL